MAPANIFNLFSDRPITCHVFNKDRTRLAVSCASHQVEIYVKSGSSWTLEHTLSEHGRMVTSLDWAPETNRLLSCSQDRNAYVWNYDAKLNRWTPSLVLLRINRAATCVRWSPSEKKFAAASGARIISICHYEEDNQWWVSKHIRKPIRSTILSLDWHPDNSVIAAGSADGTTRVFTAHIKNLDQKQGNTWASKNSFGELVAAFPAGGWVHGVSFSPSGTSLAWAAHNSTVGIVQGALATPYIISCSILPFVNLLFLSESTIVAAGHDFAPYLLKVQGNQWELMGSLDKGRPKQAEAGKTAFKMFQQMDSRGQSGGSDSDTSLKTVHQNTITCLRKYSLGRDNEVVTYSTSALDGTVCIWDMMTADLANLKL